MKNQKGITLIALVITIIVLLILAGVSIAMLTSENGILKRATQAGEKTTKGEIEEAIKLGLNEILTNKLDPTYTSTGAENDVGETVTEANLKKAIERNNSNIKTDGSGKINITVGSKGTLSQSEATKCGLTISEDNIEVIPVTYNDDSTEKAWWVVTTGGKVYELKQKATLTGATS